MQDDNFLRLPEEGCIFLPASLELADSPKAVLRSHTVPLLPELILGCGDCRICFGDFTGEAGDAVRIVDCGHAYHESCLLRWFAERTSCPSCCTHMGKLFGAQPSEGTMRWRCTAEPLEGELQASGTIVMHWEFPAGLDRQGRRFAPRSQEGYLPDTGRGREVLNLFVTAFRRKLLFDVGASISNGKYWPRIAVHIKTSRVGGAQRYGYPDSEYLARVVQELAERGVRVRLPQVLTESTESPGCSEQSGSLRNQDVKSWRRSRAKAAELSVPDQVLGTLPALPSELELSGHARRWGSHLQKQTERPSDEQKNITINPF
ncbi:unnamed protein product [Polarella glacialis]|uniref:RING-type E3 ubiquitin transferase n=1 Tax=Polarella glacialis TaxID=89957 RepID=A0A813HRH3_POLGL|nr:unnamed protein product [Polarella glacialis]